MAMTYANLKNHHFTITELFKCLCLQELLLCRQRCSGSKDEAGIIASKMKQAHNIWGSIWV
jgi:hypothetical protein